MAVEKPIYSQPLGSLNLVNWVHKGACVGMDTEIFYPDAEEVTKEPGSPGAWQARNWEPAIQVCLDCSVRTQCLEFALATKEKYGVWGGMTPEQRKAYKKHLKSTSNGSTNLNETTTVASMLAQMDFGKPLLGRSRSRKNT